MRQAGGVAVFEAARVRSNRSIERFAERFVEHFAVGDHGVHGKKRKQYFAGSRRFGIHIFVSRCDRVDAVVVDCKVDSVRKARQNAVDQLIRRDVYADNKIIGKAAFLKRFKTFEIGDGVIFDKFQALLERTRREYGALFAEFFQKKCKRRTGAERVAIRFVVNRNQKRRVVRNKL